MLEEDDTITVRRQDVRYALEALGDYTDTEGEAELDRLTAAVESSSCCCDTNPGECPIHEPGEVRIPREGPIGDLSDYLLCDTLREAVPNPGEIVAELEARISGGDQRAVEAIARELLAVAEDLNAGLS